MNFPFFSCIRFCVANIFMNWIFVFIRGVFIENWNFLIYFNWEATYWHKIKPTLEKRGSYAKDNERRLSFVFVSIRSENAASVHICFPNCTYTIMWLQYTKRYLFCFLYYCFSLHSISAFFNNWLVLHPVLVT